MFRRLQTSHRFIALLSLAVAIGVGATRTEKLMLELAGELGSLAPVTAQVESTGGDWFYFDTNRVLQSGGMTARLLETVKYRFQA